MKNLWWQVWVICLLASLALFVSVALIEAGRAPSNHWSRQIEVQHMVGLSAYAEGDNRYLEVVPSPDEGGAYLMFAHNGLTMRFIHEDGRVSAEQKVEGAFSDPDRYQGQLKNGELTLTALKNGVIKKYSMHVKAEKRQSPLQLDQTVPLKDVQDFIQTDKQLLYQDKQGFGILKGPYLAKPIENMSFLKHDGQEIVVIRMVGGKRLLESYSINDLEHPLQSYNLNGGSRISYENLTTYEGKCGKGVFVEMKDGSSANNSMMHYGFNGSLSVMEIAQGEHVLHPLAVNLPDGRVQLLFTQMQKKGKDAILNIQAGEFDGRKLMNLRYLTRSEQGNTAVGYVVGKQHSVLLSLEKKSGEDVVKMSGSSSLLIEKAKRLTGEEMVTVLFNVMLVLPMAVFTGMMPFLYVVFPTALIMGVVSIFKMHVMEYHYKKVLYGGLILHVLVKANYCYSSILNNPHLPKIHQVMPYYLNSPVSATLTLVLSTLAAFGILKLKYPQWHQGDYYGTYLTFAVVDMSIFTCLVMPYFACYMSLPVFY